MNNYILSAYASAFVLLGCYTLRLLQDKQRLQRLKQELKRGRSL